MNFRDLSVDEKSHLIRIGVECGLDAKELANFCRIKHQSVYNHLNRLGLRIKSTKDTDVWLGQAVHG